MKNFIQPFISGKSVGERPATVPLHYNDAHMSMSFKWFDTLSSVFAAMLKDAGCSAGDRLCCMTSNAVPALISALGVMKAGCVLIPVSPRSTSEQIQAVLAKCDSNWLLTDDSATAYPDSLLIETGEVNLGWLGDLRNLPESICPEIVLGNISQYSSRSDSGHAPVEDSVFRFVLPSDSGRMEEFKILPAGIERLSSQVRDLLNSSPLQCAAGFFPPALCRFFSELFPLEVPTAPYWMLSTEILWQPEELMGWLKEHDVKRLYFVADDVLNLTRRPSTLTAEDLPDVSDIVICGNLPSKDRLKKLKALFPAASIRNRVGSRRGKPNGMLLEGYDSKILLPEDQRRTRKREQWEGIFLGLIEETVFSRLRQREVRRDMKDAYLNYWRKVEEKNLSMIPQTVKMGLPGDV